MTKKEKKEKLYVHVVFNEVWISGFLSRGQDKWSVFKRELVRELNVEIRQHIKAYGLTDQPFMVSIYTASYPKTWDVSVVGEFGSVPPKGSKARVIKRAVKTVAEEFVWGY